MAVQEPSGAPTVIVFAVLALIVLGVSAVRILGPAVQRMRLEAELRRDWWSRFERDLESYTRSWRDARDAERRT